MAGARKACRRISARARCCSAACTTSQPVRLSKRSSYVKFTDAMVEKLSSQRHLGGLHTPLVLAYGTCETPEFQRQTREFFAAVQAAESRPS